VIPLSPVIKFGRRHPRKREKKKVSKTRTKRVNKLKFGNSFCSSGPKNHSTRKPSGGVFLSISVAMPAKTKAYPEHISTVTPSLGLRPTTIPLLPYAGGFSGFVPNFELSAQSVGVTSRVITKSQIHPDSHGFLPNPKEAYN